MRPLKALFQVPILFSLLVSSAAAQQAIQDAGEIDPATVAKFYKKPGYSPYAGRNYPARVYWGYTHLHTAWSVDASMSGATLTPEDAVRFARGEEVISNTGQPVKLSRPDVRIPIQTREGYPPRVQRWPERDSPCAIS